MRRQQIMLTIILSLLLIFIGGILFRYVIMDDKEIHAVDNETSSDSLDIDDEKDDEDEEEVKGVQDEVEEVDEEPEQPEEVQEPEDNQEDSFLRAKYEEGKVAYLTFDDGPSTHVTPMILDILKERDIKATFFVIGNMAEKNPEMLKRVYNEGHTISNHTYSHSYPYIYDNPQNLSNDILQWEKTIREILGQDFHSDVFRFPGGSFERGEAFHQAVKDLGYIKFDWNVVNGDGETNNFTRERSIQRFTETIQDIRNPVILMHDTDAKVATAETLNEIIDYLLEREFVFDTLNYFDKR